MGTWTDNELTQMDNASELTVRSQRPDGTLRPAVTIWHTTVGDTLYIRSAAGPENGWFRRALASGVGQVSAGGVAGRGSAEAVLATADAGKGGGGAANTEGATVAGARLFSESGWPR